MIIGIDPGLLGAIACVSNDSTLLSIYDMPTVGIKKGKKSRSIYDVVGLRKILSGFSPERATVFIEQTQSLPPGFRVQASYGLGRCEGLLEGMLSMKGVSYELVRAQEWQKHFGITKAKGDKKVQSYVIAHRLFPNAELTTPRGRKLDGRSDALLIGEWGHRRVQQKEV